MTAVKALSVLPCLVLSYENLTLYHMNEWNDDDDDDDYCNRNIGQLKTKQREQSAAALTVTLKRQKILVWMVFFVAATAWSVVYVLNRNRRSLWRTSSLGLRSKTAITTTSSSTVSLATRSTARSPTFARCRPTSLSCLATPTPSTPKQVCIMSACRDGLGRLATWHLSRLVRRPGGPPSQMSEGVERRRGPRTLSYRE